MKSLFSTLKRNIKNKAIQYVPRKVLVNRNYIKKTGRKPNLKNPKTFSDKLAWYILYYRDERMRVCTDKAAVRDYINSLGMGDLLNECYGIYDCVDDIEWETLPSKFVIKHNLSGEGLGTILVFDKNTLDLENIKETLRSWIDECPLKRARAGLWIFENRKAQILFEKLLIDDENGDLPDYKFFCFNGRVYCSYLIRNSTTKTNRHDGELTFFSNTGPNKRVPESFEYELGKQFILPKRNL